MLLAIRESAASYEGGMLLAIPVWSRFLEWYDAGSDKGVMLLVMRL